MPAIRPADYPQLRRGAWRIRCHPDLRTGEWWQDVASRLETPPSAAYHSRHAVTFRIELTAGEPCPAFLKIYRHPDRHSWLKMLVKNSKPRHALEASLDLQRQGFDIPIVLAAGERRGCALGVYGFLLTMAVPALPLDETARRLPSDPPDRRALKRRILERVGATVGRLHRLGYVHGDLVATNLLYDPHTERLYLIDHDRSRRPLVFNRRHQQYRNLVQLNRLPVANVSHADRLRAFFRYAEERGWSRETARRAARLIARRTAKRRAQLAQPPRDS